MRGRVAVFEHDIGSNDLAALWIWRADNAAFGDGGMGEQGRLLSRSKTMDATLYDSLVALAKSQGFDVSRLERVDQSCE